MNVFKFLGTVALATIFFAVSCQSNSNESKGEVIGDELEEVQDTTEMLFDTIAHDFGIVEQGNKVSHSYTFTNSGAFPLVLKSVKASCGCTVPSWTKEPVAPGAKGTVEVEFNTTGRKGMQHKTITVAANTSPRITLLNFTAEIAVPAVKKQ